MRFVKGIGLFFVYPLTMLAIGFYAGIEITQYFYPGMQRQSEQYSQENAPGQSVRDDGTDETTGTYEQNVFPVAENSLADNGDSGLDEDQNAMSVVSSSETLYVGTKYVLEEADILRHTVVETTWGLPDKYVGMNREQFLIAMETYASSPPLKELERGFVGLEVLSFARERVVVRMNYRYVQPSSSFYLAAYDNYVLVYLEDQKTVYIETEITLDSLPVDMQQEIIGMMWIENEEALYNFLEAYSS